MLPQGNSIIEISSPLPLAGPFWLPSTGFIKQRYKPITKKKMLLFIFP